MALQTTSTRERRTTHSAARLFESQAPREMTFSQLNEDVMVEIFRQFVAIDWDGPFTLMLVCTKWRDLVISTPVLWTWIMVDDSQVEWLERMEVAALLSKDLPLRIVLKPPFDSQISISHVTRRCVALHLDSKRVRYQSGIWAVRGLRWSRMIVPYEAFTGQRDELKQVSDALSCFLKNVPTDGIQIVSEDKDDACFAYSAWHIHEQLKQEVSLQQALRPGQEYIITALVFKHPLSKGSLLNQLPIADLWALLPALRNLAYLELSDNCIDMREDTALPRISLPSIQTLKIEALSRPWIPLSTENAIMLGLFGLLDFFTVPNVEYLSLSGSIQRIIAVMLRNRVKLTPSYLHLSIAVFSKATEEPNMSKSAVWHGLRRCSISYLAPRGSYFNVVLEWPDMTNAAHFMLNMLPNDCSVQLQGDKEIQLLIPYCNGCLGKPLEQAGFAPTWHRYHWTTASRGFH